MKKLSIQRRVKSSKRFPTYVYDNGEEGPSFTIDKARETFEEFGRVTLQSKDGHGDAGPRYDFLRVMIDGSKYGSRLTEILFHKGVLWKGEASDLFDKAERELEDQENENDLGTTEIADPFRIKNMRKLKLDKADFIPY